MPKGSGDGSEKSVVVNLQGHRINTEHARFREQRESALKRINDIDPEKVGFLRTANAARWRLQLLRNKDMSRGAGLPSEITTRLEMTNLFNVAAYLHQTGISINLPPEDGTFEFELARLYFDKMKKTTLQILDMTAKDKVAPDFESIERQAKTRETQWLEKHILELLLKLRGNPVDAENRAQVRATAIALERRYRLFPPLKEFEITK